MEGGSGAHTKGPGEQEDELVAAITAAAEEEPAAAAARALRLAVLVEGRAADLIDRPNAGPARRAAATALLAALRATLPDTSKPQRHTTAASRPPQLRRRGGHGGGGAGDDDAAAGPTTTAADAWRGAGPALQVLVRFEEDDIIQTVISFWREICRDLDGSWLDEPMRTAGGGGGGACMAVAIQLQVIAWLWRAGPALLAAVVAATHAFYRLTGISHLQQGGAQQAQSTAAAAAGPISEPLALLLLFLQLTAPCGSPTTGLAAADADAPAQFIELLGFDSHGTGGFGSRGDNTRLPLAAAHVLSCARAFDTACVLLQLSACDPAAAAWEAACGGAAAKGSDASIREASAPLLLAQRAGEFLVCGYGPRAGGGLFFGTTAELEACITALAVALASNSAVGQQEASPPLGIEALMHLLTSYPSWGLLLPQRLPEAFTSQHTCTPGTDGLPNDVATAEALQGTQSTQGPTGAQKQRAAAAAGGGGTGAVAETARRALGMLSNAAMAARSAPEAAGRVGELLGGCALLLRPEAGCGVQWRCEALQTMDRTVASFLAAFPEAGELQPRLWTEAALDALLTCLMQDPSIKVRRAAIATAALVAIPATSPTAGRLIRTLADKARDRDPGVASAALELAVQIPFTPLAAALGPQAFCELTTAGLGALCPGRGGEGGKEGAPAAAVGGKGVTAVASKQGQQKQPAALSQPGREAFTELLKSALQPAPLAPVASGNIAAAADCRRALLALLHDPCLEPLLAHCCSAMAAVGGVTLVTAEEGGACEDGGSGEASDAVDLAQGSDGGDLPAEGVRGRRTARGRRAVQRRPHRRRISDSDDGWDSDGSGDGRGIGGGGGRSSSGEDAGIGVGDPSSSQPAAPVAVGGAGSLAGLAALDGIGGDMLEMDMGEAGADGW